MKNGELETAAKDEAKLSYELTGEHYLACLTRFHEIVRPRTYLEIGTWHGYSLNLARCAAVAVDPKFEISVRLPHESAPALCLYQIRSDKFFKQYDPRAILGAPIDLAFLDGLHLFEQLLRDFINTERVCHPQGAIILHDCLPLDFHMTRPEQDDRSRRELSRYPAFWTGDVWKILPVVQRYRPDLRVEVFNAQPTGLAVISRLNPQSTILADHQAEIVEQFRCQPADEFASFTEFRSTVDIRDTADLGRPNSFLGTQKLVSTLLAKHPLRDFFRAGSELREKLLEQAQFEDITMPLWRELARNRDHVGIALLHGETITRGLSLGATSESASKRDVAFCKPAVSSSVSRWSHYQDPERDACGANGDPASEDYGFHTQRETDPWWMVDLLEEHLLEEIAILNRPNAPYRFRTFRIETSCDGTNWMTQFTQAQGCDVSSDPARPWHMRFTEPVPARHVRIVLLGTEILHLRQVQIFGRKRIPESEELAASTLGP